MLLWSAGALVTAALTESRGALAVALVAGCLWSCTRATDATDALHLPFLALWFAAAALAFAWNSRVAAHLVALAALPWWLATAAAAALQLGPSVEPFFILASGAALLTGGGLALAAAPSQRAVCLGEVLSIYGTFSLGAVAALNVMTAADDFFGVHGAASQPLWAILCGVAGVSLAAAAGAITKRPGAAFAASAIGLVLVAALGWTTDRAAEPSSEAWLAYGLSLCAMLCLVVSGMLDESRPRIVAGWLGIAGVIAGITWAVKGSLLRRSAFLAAAGIATVILATLLNRLLPRADR
jgi:hypothetical protein